MSNDITFVPTEETKESSLDSKYFHIRTYGWRYRGEYDKLVLFNYIFGIEKIESENRGVDYVFTTFSKSITSMIYIQGSILYYKGQIIYAGDLTSPVTLIGPLDTLTISVHCNKLVMRLLMSKINSF